MSNTTGKRLAKNSAFMYIRMFVLMIVSFYTSRVVLQQLGVDDFGIYNLVGSIVAMFTSLRIIFASSTQRYLNYELGLGNEQNLKLVFNLSIYINLIIGIIFVVAVEALGIWFFKHGINIPGNRIDAAFIVFQCATFVAAISILTSVFDAVIIAHEHMNFYAGIAIAESIMKLGIAYLLSRSPIDKLIFYGWLLLGVSIVVLLINLIFCKWHFREVKLCLIWDKVYFKQMTLFAGWNFLGNTAYTISQNGLNIILNIFGGPVANAARGIAFQVNYATQQFLNNLNVVMSPYCVKAYASNRNDDFQKAIFIFSKFLLFIQLMLSIPLIFLAPWILQVWLGQVPEFSVDFLRLVLCISMIRSTHGPLDTIFKAYGNLKYYQISESIILTSPLIFSYFLLKLGLPLWSLFGCCILSEIVNLVVILILLHNIVNFNSKLFATEILLPALLFVMLLCFVFIWIQHTSSFWFQSIICIICMGGWITLWWAVLLNSNERLSLKKIFLSSINAT